MTKLNKALSYFPIIALGAFCYLAITDRTLASEKCADQVSTEIAVTDRTKILIIGEMHGTQQGPAYFCAMVHALLQIHAHVLVALELPDQNQPLIDSILMSNGDAASTTALLATPFWRRDDQDGRSSEAMLGLLGSLAWISQTQAVLAGNRRTFWRSEHHFSRFGSCGGGSA
jgi:hypothetical protein